MGEQIVRPFYKLYAWQALEEWGEDAQLDMVIEECLELALVIERYKRGRIEKRQTYSKILGEVADVYLMLDQVREMFCIKGKDVEEKIREKIVRLGVRIDMAELSK